MAENRESKNEMVNNIIPDDSKEWTTVVVRKRIRKPIEKKIPAKLDRDDVLKKVGEYAATHSTKPIYGCVYGSVARGNHRIGSDTDILLLYKAPSKNRRPNASRGVGGKIYITDQRVREMKQELELLLGCNVDLRVYFVRNNEVFVPEESMWFAECAQADSVPVYQNTDDKGSDNYFKKCFFTPCINY